MSLYSYRGVNTQGSVFTGQLEAENSDAVRKTLSDQGVIPLSVKQTQKQFLWLTVLFRFRRVRTEELVLLTRQFYTLFKSGVGMKILLNTLVLQTQNKTLRNTLQRIQSDVVEGSTLSKAFAKHPDVFSELYVSMIAAGEEAGILEDVLHNLTIVLEKEVEIRNGIKSATLYPKIVLFVLSLAVAVMLAWIIPKFQSFYAHYKAPLPLPTQIVLNLSSYTKKYIVYVIPLAIVGSFLFKRFYATEKGQVVVDGFMLKVPVFGSLIQKVAVAKFTRTMGTLLASGVPIIQGLDITAKTAGNKIIEGAVLSIIEEIKQGKTIAEPLEKKKIFPNMVVQMIGVGEAAGALDSMLNKIADFYDEEVDTAVEGLTSLLEPALMAFLGVTVGFIVVAMYLPIFKLASIAGGG